MKKAGLFVCTCLYDHTSARSNPDSECKVHAGIYEDRSVKYEAYVEYSEITWKNCLMEPAIIELIELYSETEEGAIDELTRELSERFMQGGNRYPSDVRLFVTTNDGDLCNVVEKHLRSLEDEKRAKHDAALRERMRYEKKRDEARERETYERLKAKFAGKEND